MKKRPRTKSKPKASKDVPPTLPVEAVPPPPVVTDSQSSPVVMEGPRGEIFVMPPPGQLLMEAMDEPNYRDLNEYSAVIDTLRGKGFSFREIAEWLSTRRVPVDHNTVYRIYTSGLSHDEARVEEEEARNEADAEESRNR